jgi:hypothetical protein
MKRGGLFLWNLRNYFIEEKVCVTLLLFSGEQGCGLAARLDAVVADAPP